ncbi:hypothetical protein G5I_11754 [Acromyrmex echinatior]|uniref:Uncharacterized protein n=1 Tax=Acromyrmex echinatior TaxID=103372 RepID=F4X0H5_ACREC|nr:hypothetical protein G5I_11754 [Acromyrmex echinatior]
MLPGSEYLLLRCRVQGVGVVNVGYTVTEREKRERERESYVGWLVEKARDKAVVVAAGWVDLYVAGVEGVRESLTAAAAAAAAAGAAAVCVRPRVLLRLLQPVPSGGSSAKQRTRESTRNTTGSRRGSVVILGGIGVVAAIRAVAGMQS